MVTHLQDVLSEPRWTDLPTPVQRLGSVTILIVMEAPELIAAAHPVVPLGLLHMCGLQR